MLYVSATGSVVLRVNSSANNNTAFFRMFHFSTEAERLAKFYGKSIRLAKA